ncbi:LuxR C-terminal-related transcriptional regulator [Streptomyces sp. TLI_55]|uniref:LuxR C-terminal-related transcriptional regulator n=1 Tax=Streptomyces sp. TLI_55 TaxID=1938861 RepID=UPI00211CF2EA
MHHGEPLVVEGGGQVLGQVGVELDGDQPVVRGEPAQHGIGEDVRMPGVDGLTATRKLCAGPDAPKVLVVTTFDLDEYVYGALRAGASGYLVKDALGEEILVTVRAVLRGDVMLGPSVIRRLVERFVLPAASTAPDDRLGLLTAREREVLTLVARGLSNQEIAARLFLGETTVKTHLGRILGKLELRDRVHAVIYGYESGLIRVGG